MLNKTPLLHQSLGPHVFLFFFFSLSFFQANSLEHGSRLAHFLAWASKTLSRRHTVPSPPQEGAWCLRVAVQALQRALLALHVNQGISVSFSLFYFLIINSRPPGSGPLKDQHHSNINAWRTTWTVWKGKKIWPFISTTVGKNPLEEME